MFKMGFELDKKYKKYAAIAMGACYRSALKHPVVVVVILFTIWFYRSFPRLFSFLFYASPIILSTSALLGTLLLYGHQNAPKFKKQGKPQHHEIDSLKYRVIEDAEFDWKNVRSEAKEDAFGNQVAVVNTVNFNDDHRRVETISRRSSIDSNVSMADKKVIEEVTSEVCNHNQKTDFGGEKMFVSRCPHCQYPLPNNTQDYKRWETGSELAENSSMAGTFPMIDHLPPPILQPEVPHPANMSNVNSYAPSNHSIASNHHDDDNDNQDDEEEANVNEKDEETVSNLGKTETDRTQPIENLIARKKAIKNMRIQAEENLVNINLDISYSATPHASTRRNSFDQPFDINETVIESVPTVIMPIINPIDLQYDQSGDKSYPVGPTFQSDPSSFQPNHQFTHTHESFEIGPSNRQNEGYYTYGVSENVSQRSRSFDDDDDVVKTNGAETRKENSTVGPTFQSDPLSFQPHDQFNHRHENSDVGPSTLGVYHVSKVIEYVSYNNDDVKIHQVAEGDGRLYEVKTSEGVEKGESSSSSAFSDVTDHLDDEEDDQYDYRSAFMPSTPDRQFQSHEQRKNDDHTIKRSPKSEHDEGRLSQNPNRVPRWFGWKQ